jgi:hypothetical protein
MMDVLDGLTNLLFLAGWLLRCCVDAIYWLCSFITSRRASQCLSWYCQLWISVPISSRIKGACSRRACDAFFRAVPSPISYHPPPPCFLVLARNRPGGIIERISVTMVLAICVFLACYSLSHRLGFAWLPNDEIVDFPYGS